MENSNETAPEYFTSPRKLANYRWYMPLLTGLLTAVFYVVFSMVVAIIAAVIVGLQGNDPIAFFYSFAGGYDTMDAYSAMGAFLTMGSVAVFIPALWLALKITRERPFQTVTTARGRWNMNFFMKALLLSFIVNGIPQIVMAALDGGFDNIQIRFTVLGFIILLILLPFQCIGEEYIFRGFMGQTFSSWVKNPVIGILLATLFFALNHPYNIIGKLYVAVMGLTLSFAVWYIKGIEAASAFHIVNNFFSFVLTGISAAELSSDVRVMDLVVGLITNAVFILLLIFVDKKFKWFSC